MLQPEGIGAGARHLDAHIDRPRPRDRVHVHLVDLLPADEPFVRVGAIQVEPQFACPGLEARDPHQDRGLAAIAMADIANLRYGRRAARGSRRRRRGERRTAQGEGASSRQG